MSLVRSAIRASLHLSSAVLCLIGSTTPLESSGTSLRVNRWLVVSAGGTPVENCQGLLAALAGITDASESNRYAIRLEPGTYDCPATVTMKSWVDLEGSGRESTLLTTQQITTLNGAASSEVRHLRLERRGGEFASAWTVDNRESARFSHVDILCRDAPSSLYGMLNSEGANPILHDVEIEVDGAFQTEEIYGLVNDDAAPIVDGLRVRVRNGKTVSVGIYNQGTDNAAPFHPIVLRNVDVAADGNGNTAGIFNIDVVSPPIEILFAKVRVQRAAEQIVGVHNRSANVVIRNSTIESRRADEFTMPMASLEPPSRGVLGNYFGILNEVQGGTPPFVVQVDNSQVIGSVATVVNTASFTTRIGGSLLSGGDADTSGGGTLVCAGVWDENGDFSASSCPLDP